MKLTEEELVERFSKLETELVRRTAELEERFEGVEAVSYAVSHDLRGPLRAMQTYAQALLDNEGASLSESGYELMNQIIHSAAHMAQLTEKLLEFNHVSNAPAELRPVSVLAASEDVLSYLAPDLHAAETQVTIPSSDITVVAHYATLFQTLANLITNAVKFVRPGQRPRVTLGAELRGEYGHLWVRDNGVGIYQKDQQRIFHMFERLQPSLETPGSGIGLAIVKRGVERMNGRVGVESRRGKGSRFWIELPAAG